MSYVQPTGTIQLFRGVNLDNRYMHTLYFPNRATQTSFFDSIVDASLSFTNQYYTRPNRKTLRVKINAENCQDVSYLRFNNRGNKWYYAFVLGINYVNENATDIVYEIDVMQTWFMSSDDSPTQMINPCMVLREHASTDKYGENLEAEPVGSEVYDFEEITPSSMANNFNNYKVIAQFSNPYGAGEASPRGVNKYDGIITGGSFFAFEIDTSEDLDQMSTRMESMLGSWDKNQQKSDVLDMYMFPTAYLENTSRNYNIDIPTDFDNYVPQNRKLFAYPYSFLLATTNDGDTAMYRWEYFDQFLGERPTQQVNIETNACRVGGGSIELHPHDYNGISNNFDSKLVMNNFPKVSYTYDAYQAFLANGGSSKLAYQSNIIQRRGTITTAQLAWNTALDTAQSAITIGKNIAANNPVAIGQSSIHAAQQFGNAILQNQMIGLDIEEAQNKINFQFKDAKYQPDVMVGSTSCNIAVGQGFLKFRLFNAHVRDDEMIRIDDFFSVYGYATNKVKLPNMTGRPYWNFVQTKDCNIKGNMPSSSKAAIAKIFDGGIFFWNYQRGLGNIGNFRQQIVSGTGQIVNK